MKAKEAIKLQHKTEESRANEAKNWDFFMNEIPETDPKYINIKTIRGTQLVRPLIEFSGACAGCGETPYIKLLTQICGDHMMIANATGCSSIYGANLPTTPYTKRADGRGPAWANSLFEDNAEFGLGMRLAADKMAQEAKEILTSAMSCENCSKSGLKEVAERVLANPQKTQEEIEAQRADVAKIKEIAGNCNSDLGKRLAQMAQYLIKRSVWIIGGDGWAYDIGYGGLDHVLASGKNVKVLVMDTEVYSNTGGQMSKATPIGAIAKFADGGKVMAKKDIGLMAMTYENIYVGKVSIGANMNHTLKTLLEAEAYDGPALVIAYAHCINHGINMSKGLEAQKKAVETGHWPLFRFNPELRAEGKNPFTIDSKEPVVPFMEFANGENRFKQLLRKNPDVAKTLFDQAQKNVKLKYALYKQLSELKVD
jgi:pyruvate-ferredoxin/flavodoxin oxidoreductase